MTILQDSNINPQHLITTIDHTAKTIAIHQHLAAKQNVFLLLKLPTGLIDVIID